MTEREIVEKLASMSPISVVEYHCYCFFCDADIEERDDHKPDCLWCAARAITAAA
jgi:hypothetical protein